MLKPITGFFKGLCAGACLSLVVGRTAFAADLIGETFEGLSTGPLQGQNGWTATPSGNALVQGAVTHGGGAACHVSNGDAGSPVTEVRRGVAGSSATNAVWSDWWCQPAAMPVGGKIMVPSNATTILGVAAGSGFIVVYDGKQAVVCSNGPALTAGAWTRFTVRSDYATRRWSLWANEAGVAANLQFYNTDIDRFASFNLDEGSTNATGSYLDDVHVREEETDTRAGLPFIERFDPLLSGDVEGQHGWHADGSGIAIVQTNTAAEGAKSCSLSNPGPGFVRLYHEFAADRQAGPVVRTDWCAKPVFVPLKPFFFDRTPATLCFVENSHGYVVVYDGRTQVVLSNRPAVTAGAWTEFSIRADFTNRTWSLLVNGQSMAANLSFYNTNATALSKFVIEEGGSGAASYVDAIRIGANRASALMLR